MLRQELVVVVRSLTSSTHISLLSLLTYGIPDAGAKQEAPPFPRSHPPAAYPPQSPSSHRHSLQSPSPSFRIQIRQAPRYASTHQRPQRSVVPDHLLSSASSRAQPPVLVLVAILSWSPPPRCCYSCPSLAFHRRNRAAAAGQGSPWCTPASPMAQSECPEMKIQVKELVENQGGVASVAPQMH